MPGLFLLFFANRTSPYIERRNEIWEKLYLKELAKFILMGGIVGSIAWLMTVLIRLIVGIFKRGSLRLSFIFSD